MDEQQAPLPSVENLELTLTEDRCALLLTGEVPHEALDAAKERLTEELRRLGCKNDDVARQVLAAVEERFSEQANSTVYPTVSFQHKALATGTPPTDSEDAVLEWAQDFFRTGFEIDPETDTVDYRERASHLSVEEGQLLATVYPARPGEPGIDVFGKAIAPRRPKTIRIRKGANVRYEEGEGCYYAAASGRLRYANSVLAVDNVFTITDSVNLETGNVRHPGAVIVGKNIESDAKVEAAGDIEVNGYIENAEVICGGDLIVKGGITGGRGCIRVAGEVRAKFIQNAEISAHGNVLVEREIDQCRIRSRGAVVVSRGRIVGGSIKALRGVDADRIGSDGGIVTEIISGEDFELEEKLAALEVRREEHIRMREKIQEKLEPFMRVAKIPDNIKAAITALRTQVKELARQIEAIEAEMEGLRAEFHEQRVLEVIVRRYVAPDAVFKLANLALRARDGFPGPVKVGIREGDIHFMETTVRR